MKGCTGFLSLRFTLCLSFALLIIPPLSFAQNAEDKPASQAPRVVRPRTTNVDTTTRNASEDSDSSSSTATTPATPDPNYIVGPEDVIEIEVFDVPELKGTVRVAADGKIALPLIGRVQASGLTSEQLRQSLADKWGEDYLQDPQVTVFVKEFKAKPVSVIGAVEKPGLYPLTGQRTLIEMLSTAGGFGKKGTSAAGRTVVITRKSGFKDLQTVPGMHVSGPDQIEIDLNRLLYARDEGLNIEIKPEDIISVTKADVVYVLGAVKLAGGFVLEDRPTLTVLQAISMAGGFTATAAKGSARILKTHPDGSQTEVPINLKKVIDGKAENTTLAANDTLFVPDSKTKMVGARALDASIYTVSGWLIWTR